MKKLLFTLLLAAATLPGWADDLYIVGDATLLSDAGNSGNTGWAVGSGNRTLTHMTEESTNVYTWKGLLKKGYFKICNGESVWTGYRPLTANQEIYADGNALSMQTTDDYNWQVVIPGIYNVTVNTSKNTITITPDWYDISTADELIAFANYVNAATESNYQGARWARLTADIDMSDKTFPGIGRDNKWQRYHGTFDGQQHKISNLNMTSEHCALVTVAGGGCTIKNLLIDNTCEFNGTGRIAAFISASNWTDFGVPVTIENCGNEANVTGTANNCAGLLGCNYGNGVRVTIKNSFNAGNISSTGSESAPISGWTGANATISNTWNIGEIANEHSNNSFLRWDGSGSSYTNCFTTLNWGSSISGKTVGYDASKVSTGEFCYELNGDQSSINWYQNITSGTVDSHPVPFSSHNRVYANGEVDCAGHSVGGGTLTYSNSETSILPDHQYENGFCKVCDKYLENAFAATNGWYEVSQPWQLRWLAVSVNEHNSTYKNANIKLTADIDYTAYTNQAAMFGDDGDYYEGTFDGQFHTVTVAFENTTANETALFRRIQNATIQNLKVAGNITTDKKFAGGICTEIKNHGTIQNCWSAVNITDNASGDATHGGILAKTNISGADINIQIKNCLYSGNLNATNREGNGGIVGWTSNTEDVHVSNCLVIGDLSFADNGNNGVIARSSGDFSNNYYTSNVGSLNNINKGYGTSKAATDLTSGALCYILNGNVSAGTNWYQNLESNVDSTPVPFSTHSLVYANGDLNCDGTSKGAALYSNTEGENRDAHNYQDGICTVCNAFNVNYLNLVDGFYEIDNMNGINWFSKYVNAGNPTANAKLTADIAMQSENELGYTPIGSAEHPYRGHFDGQGHSVTLKINNPSYSYQGLFGIITDGVSIEKVIVKGTVIGNDYVGGIAGGTNGGSSNVKKTNIWNCGNEATITANGANGAGIIGVNKDGSASVILLNCYNTGNITSNREGGAMSGWLGGGWSNVRNCYNSGTIKNNGATSKAFGRNNGCYFTNCYYTESSGTDNSTENHDNGSINMVADAALTSGELCWKLGTDFTQDFSEANHPTIGSKEVHAGKWFNNDDWDVFYNEEGSSRTAYVLNLDETKTSFSLDPNFTLTAKNVNVARNIPAGQWIGLCLPFDYDIPSGWEVRELTSVNGSGEDASMKFTAATSIVAGKPYIVKPTAAVTTIAAENKTIATAASTIANGGVNMIGNFAQTSIPVGSYYINTFSQLKKLTGSAVNMKGFRAYFTVGSYVKALNFDFDDDATGISLMEDGRSQMEDGAIYNVAGQRLNKMQKGINIVNGKKILK